MAFALIALGILLFIAAYQNNVAILGHQLSVDLMGPKGFLIWLVALFIIGAIGYAPKLERLSRIFLVLILVVVFLANKGFFTQLTTLVTAAGSAKSIDLSKLLPSSFTTKPKTATEQSSQDASNAIAKEKGSTV